MSNITSRIANAATGPALSAEERAQAAGFKPGTWGFQGFLDGRNGIPARKFSNLALAAKARSLYWIGYKAGEQS